MILVHLNGFSQTYLGVKLGANATNIKFDHEVYKKFYNPEIAPGFSGGVTFLYENQDKYGFYTEVAYSSKGKKIESDANDYLTNIAQYQYIDIPIMFRIKFEEKKFNWFLQLGPEMNYWLGGKGQFQVYEPDRDQIVIHDYKINFGEIQTSFDYLNVSGENRLQIGLAFGGGMIWELDNANYVGFDLRYSMGHTYQGEFENASIPGIGLVDNFEYTNNVISLSAFYYLDILEKNRLSKNKYRKRR